MENVSDSKQTEDSSSNVHNLSPNERIVLLAFNENAKSAKVKIHDLNVALEAAQEERKQAEAHFGAALVSIAACHNIPAPINVSADFMYIEGVKRP